MNDEQPKTEQPELADLYDYQRMIHRDLQALAANLDGFRDLLFTGFILLGIVLIVRGGRIAA